MGSLETQSLLRFVPGALDWSVQTPAQAVGPWRETHVAALLIADVSGFTTLTARYAREGNRAGADRISLVLNEFMAALVSQIELQGGKILGFEGDSLLAGWKVENEAVLRDAVWLAASCALELNRISRGATAESLSLRCGVAAGEVQLLHTLQGTRQRRLILTGASVDDVTKCAVLADSGDVLASEGAWRLVSEFGEGYAHSSGIVRVAGLRPLAGIPLAVPAVDGRTLDPAQYVPSFLAARLRSSLSPWLAEIRTVSALFFKLDGPDLFENLELLDSRLHEIHAGLTRFGGVLLRLAGSGGGLQGLCAFGLPGNAHKDDARRAVLAALNIKGYAEEKGLRLSVGLATGDTFCGAIGSEHRADYTVVGDAVNRSARLHSVSLGRVLVDDVTAQTTRGEILFDGPWPLQVKGGRAHVDTFVAVAPRPAAPPIVTQLVGRQLELGRLRSHLEGGGLGRPRVLVVDGPAGVGKSALLDSFIGDCRAAGVEVVLGAADENEHDTPYFVFRKIMSTLVGGPGAPPSEAVEKIKVLLRDRHDLHQFIPLLGDIVNVGHGAASRPVGINGLVRSENLHRILCEIINGYVKANKSIFVFEDAHWMDNSSLSLLREFTDLPIDTPIVLTARNSEDVLARLNIRNVETLTLPPLGGDHVAALMERLVSSKSISPELREFVTEHSGGNPFFVGEFCNAINQARVEGGGEEVAPDGTIVKLPESAHAVILNRTDALDADLQVVLKVASALGTTFRVQDLQVVRLIGDAGIDVSESVHALKHQHMFKKIPGDADTWTFSHAITRDVVYDSMPSEQRRRTHAAIAESIERQPLTTEAEMLPALFNQWQRAENREGVARYIDRLAELRLRQFDNRSAVHLIETMLDMPSGANAGFTPRRLGVAYLVLGEARLNLGKTDAAQKAYEHGLKLLGLPLPQGDLAVKWQLALQLLEQVMRRMRRKGAPGVKLLPTSRSSFGDDLFLRAARAIEDLTRIYYIRSEKFRLIHATLWATNLAERYGRDAPFLAVNYAGLGAICGVIPLRRQAGNYLGMASDLAKELADPNVNIRVNLLAGLYETSTGNWLAAKQNFDAGIQSAQQLGDTRRWSELAVCLEMISSPWLGSPTYSGASHWANLIAEICTTSRRRGDLHILGCGLVAAARGYLALGQPTPAGGHLAELAAIVDTNASALEQIHVVEVLARLTSQSLGRHEIENADAMLARCCAVVEQTNPGMKSRTLPALHVFFEVAAQRMRLNGGSGTASRAAKLAVEKLIRFARIYPIGRPYRAICQGDLYSLTGYHSRSIACWRAAYEAAIALELPAIGMAAIERLEASSDTLRSDDVSAANSLRQLSGRLHTRMQ